MFAAVNCWTSSMRRMSQSLQRPAGCAQSLWATVATTSAASVHGFFFMAFIQPVQVHICRCDAIVLRCSWDPRTDPCVTFPFGMIQSQSGRLRTRGGYTEQTRVGIPQQRVVNIESLRDATGQPLIITYRDLPRTPPVQTRWLLVATPVVFGTHTQFAFHLSFSRGV